MYNELEDIKHVPIPNVIKEIDPLGVATYIFESPDPRAVQIDIMFLGGRGQETKKVSAFATHQLIKENKKKISGNTIFEFLNQCGAQLSFQSFMDGSVITFRSLDRFITTVLPIVCDNILEPNYDVASLELLKEKQLQELTIDKKYNDTLAHRLLMKQLFGEHHPYGYSVTEDNLCDLDLDDLRKQHRRAYIRDHCVVIIMATQWKPILNILKSSLIDRMSPGTAIKIKKDFDIIAGDNITSDDHFGPQWAIKMGKILNGANFNIGTLLIMNNLLGGFYGSRFIKSIRETLGLTYDISTQVEFLKNASFFSIHTEVSPSNKARVLETLMHEILHLQSHPVSTEELRMVKNYTLGEFLRLLDGPQRQIQTLKSLLLEGRDFQDLEKIFSQIIRIDPDELLYDFQSFVDFDKLTKIMVR